jgi:hypothetical protein
MNPTPIQNPFSYAYDLIYKAVTTWPPLAAEVSVGNFINLDVAKYKPKTNVNMADAPAIKISERKIIANTLSQDSQGVFLKCLYPIEIRSGRYGVDRANLVSILVLQALTAAGTSLGDKPSPANIIDKWEWIDAAVVPFDNLSKQPEYVVNCGVLVHFSMHRRDFLLTTFT